MASAAPASTQGSPAPPPVRRPPPFERLGRQIVRHPRYVLLLWVVLVLAALPLLPLVGNATTSSSLSLPTSAVSQQESYELGKVFPNASAPSDTLIVLQGNDLTSPTGRNATLELRNALDSDRSLHGVDQVVSLYSSYQAYFEGQAELALGVLGPGVVGPDSALAGINGTADLIFGTASAYDADWLAEVEAQPTSPPSDANYPAYQAASSQVGPNPFALQNLTNFYEDFNGSTFDCASQPISSLDACSNAILSALWPPGPPGVPPPLPISWVVTHELDLENYTQWPSVQNATELFLAGSSGVAPALLAEVWSEFPHGSASADDVANWSQQVIGNGTVATYRPAVPASIYQQFISPADNVTVLIVTLNYSDDGPQDANLVPEIDSLARTSLARSDPSGGISYVQTGDAALVVNEQNVINEDTATILPVTIVLLLVITALYFRAPLTPVLVLLVIGLSLLLGLAAMVILTTFTTQVTQTSLTLLITFVLGVGTDYSVFLTARYREELRTGKSHEEAIVTSVTWAGESIATSGSTVVLATIAMTLGGTELISDWGRVLALGVTVTILVALTLVPAFLSIVGPRLFWPYTGDRFRRQAKKVEETFRARNSYFHRASRFSYRRPGVVLGIVVLVSLPLIYLALTAPLSYAYFQQLPTDQPSAQGLQTLSGNFGPGYVFPLDVLVTFDSPLVGAQNATNLAEFSQAAFLALAMNATSGVHSVGSLIGTGGAPVSQWLGLTTAPAAERALLLGTLSNYLGKDGRTLEYVVALTANGNSNAAVATMDRIETNISLYHPADLTVSAVYYGGAPSLTKDLQEQLSQSTEVMFLIIVVGLLVILLLALGSAILPPRAVVTIAMSVAWSWAITYVVFVQALNLSLFFYVPPVLFLLVMGLGMDYDIFIMTRVREERLKGKDLETAVVDAIGHTAGIITAAAVILAGAFFALTFAHITLLRVLGFSVGAAILLDAAVIRTYLVSAILGVGGDKIWWTPKFLRWIRASPSDVPVTERAEAAAPKAP